MRLRAHPRASSRASPGPPASPWSCGGGGRRAVGEGRRRVGKEMRYMGGGRMGVDDAIVGEVQASCK